MFVQQTMKTASSDEELAFKQKERDMAAYLGWHHESSLPFRLLLLLLLPLLLLLLLFSLLLLLLAATIALTMNLSSVQWTGCSLRAEGFEACQPKPWEVPLLKDC